MGLVLVDPTDVQESGGSGGRSFSDVGIGPSILAGFNVYSKSWIDAIQPIYVALRATDWDGADAGGYQLGARWGGNAGGLNYTQLVPPQPGFGIVKIEGRWDWYVDSITATWRLFVKGVATDQFYTQTAGGAGGANTFRTDDQNL